MPPDGKPKRKRRRRRGKRPDGAAPGQTTPQAQGHVSQSGDAGTPLTQESGAPEAAPQGAPSGASELAAPPSAAPEPGTPEPLAHEAQTQRETDVYVSTPEPRESTPSHDPDPPASSSTSDDETDRGQ